MTPNGFCETSAYYDTVITYSVSCTFEYEEVEQKSGYGIPVNEKRKALSGFPDNRSYLLKRQVGGIIGK